MCCTTGASLIWTEELLEEVDDLEDEIKELQDEIEDLEEELANSGRNGVYVWRASSEDALEDAQG